MVTGVMQQGLRPGGDHHRIGGVGREVGECPQARAGGGGCGEVGQDDRHAGTADSSWLMAHG